MPTYKLFASLLVAGALLIAFVPAGAQDKPDDGKTTSKTDDKADKADAEVDPFALYKKESRTWMHKTTSKVGDMDENVSYVRYEVKEVADDYAVLMTSVLDKNKKPVPDMDRMESKVRFETAENDQSGQPDVETEETTISILDTEWKAVAVSTETDGMTTKSWSSMEYPGLLLKSETSGKSGGMKFESKTELVEFSDLQKTTAGGTDDADIEELDWTWLYRKVGRSWMHKNVSGYSGDDENNNVSYTKWEVTEVHEDYAMCATSMLDKDKKPFTGMKSIQTKLDFKPAESAGQAPEMEKREETIKLLGKEWETVAMTSEIGGTTTTSWMSKKYPGLVLKMESKLEIGDKDWVTTMELVEFSDLDETTAGSGSEDPTAGNTDNKANEPDPGKQWDALYQEGAWWVHKMSQGQLLMKTKVVSVKDGFAKTKVSMKMGDGDWMEPTDSEMRRPEKQDALDDPKWKETGKGTETIKFGDVELKCEWIEGEYDGKKVRTVLSIKYGIVVKAEYDGDVTMELTEIHPK